MVKFSDKGSGWHGEPKGHSKARAYGSKYGIAGWQAKKQGEQEYLKSKYYGSKRLTKREIKNLNKRRIRYARKYNEDAVKGIPRGM
jgi:hypothetical protein